MKIGIFDSGLGGLFILKNLRKTLSKFDYVYLGDTKNLPYGDKSQKELYNLTKNAINFLFKQDCQLVIIACNTASSVLRKVQQDWLPYTKYTNHRVLGVIRPTAEQALSKQHEIIGIIGTRRTIQSETYTTELLDKNPNLKVISLAAPELVKMIESDNIDAKKIQKTIQPLLESKIQTLILACTHFGIIKRELQKIFGKKVLIISQENLLPQKISAYLNKHPEILHRLSQNKSVQLYVTKKSLRYQTLSKKWFGEKTIINRAILSK
jgi:glutamate racemase